MKDLIQKINWEVSQKPVKITGLHHDSLKALYRNDNSKLLSIRSSKYQTFKNTDLMQLVERIAEAGKFSVEGYEPSIFFGV
ncbi:MAG: hypothetical protein NTY88_05460 [Bacteroidetes bacterium]|nr:hypothetical protein [Bacteroidota bacterium]